MSVRVNFESSKKAHDRDGVICIRRAFSNDWLAVMARVIEHGRANPGPMYLDYSADTKPGTYVTDFWVWRENPDMRAFIFESPAAELCGRLMGVDSVMLVTDNWLVRERGAVNRAPWHHDDPYFDVGGKWCVLWAALEPVGPGEGVVFLKGSHRWGRRFMPLSFAGKGLKAPVEPPYEAPPDFSQELDRYEILEFTLEPGDCLVFDSLTVHGAPNPRPSRRNSRRFTMRFAEGEAIYQKRGPWTDEQCEYLEGFGHKQGQRLAGALLPILWESEAKKEA